MDKHKYGQHYTPKILTDKYKDLFKNIKSKGLTVVDPFVGDGNLLIDYLSTFSNEEAIKIIENEKIRGYDIDKKAILSIKKRFKDKYNISDEKLDIIFMKNNSFVKNPCKKNDFILTNPPYLARNTCKRKYPKDYNVHFSRNFFSDYYELSLYRFRKHNGIWIIPSNFLSSQFMTEIKKTLLSKSMLRKIYLFENPIFKDTNISVMSFYLERKDKDMSIQNNLPINFVGFNGDTLKNIDINNDGVICDEWARLSKMQTSDSIVGLLREDLKTGEEKILLLNESYELENFYINEKNIEKIKNNHLYLRSTDTGSKDGMLGFYTMDELYPNDERSEAKSLITKKTSRLTVPLFFYEYYSYEDQIKIKNKANQILNDYRDKYNSIFLTNFKNSTRKMQRKRISFKEAYGIINKSIMELKESKDI